MLIDGIHVPLTVPFARDGALALSKLESNVRRYSLAAVAGLVALAPGGEAAALSDAECGEALRAVGRAAKESKVLVAGVARESVRGTLELIDVAAAAGFDVALVVAPALGDAEVRVFLKSVADASALPVMLWSDGLPIAIVAELSRHSNVLGMYDVGLSEGRYAEIMAATAQVKREVVVTNVFAPATRRMRAAAASVTAGSSLGGVAVLAAPATVKLRTKVVGFQVMAAGRCDGLLPLLEVGVAGAMPVLSAAAPQAVYEIFAAFKDGDPALSALKVERVMAADALVQELGVAGVKYGCDVNGYAGGAPRLPRLALMAKDRELVEQVLREIPS